MCSNCHKKGHIAGFYKDRLTSGSFAVMESSLPCEEADLCGVICQKEGKQLNVVIHVQSPKSPASLLPFLRLVDTRSAITLVSSSVCKTLEMVPMKFAQKLMDFKQGKGCSGRRSATHSTNWYSKRRRNLLCH